MPVFTLLESILITIEANKMFPNIHSADKKLDNESKKDLTKKIVAMSMHQVGSVLVLSTDNLILSKMFGLGVVGIYSNYLLIITALMSIISIIINSLQASMGNMVATTGEQYVYKRYKQINLVFTWFIGWCSICLMCLFQPFILLWTKDASYLFPTIVVLVIVVAFYLKENLGITLMFKNVAQLVWYDRWAPVIQGIVNIGVSIIAAKYMGVVGVFIGTIVSTIVGPFMWCPIVLYKYYFKQKIFKYWVGYILITVFINVKGYGN